MTTNFSFPLLMIFKYLLISASFFYLIFAFVVIRQISIMKRTLITPVSGKITLLGWIHFGFALTVLFSFLFFVQP
ncbi:MAG: DUF5657 family protein [Patescibacteria group bacterium]